MNNEKKILLKEVLKRLEYVSHTVTNNKDYIISVEVKRNDHNE